MTRAQIVGIISGLIIALAAAALVVANLMGWTPSSSAANPQSGTQATQTIASQLCGPYALQHLAERYERQTSVAQIAEWAGTDNEGTSMLGLAIAAQELGFTAQGWEARPRDLVRMPRPAIAHFSDNHWVVVEPVDESHVSYWDPVDQETHEVELTDFTELWSGYLLTVEP